MCFDRIVEDLWSYMKERELIRRRRAEGLEWPWTEDPILQEYKFTNVKREYDRVTLHYLDWIRGLWPADGSDPSTLLVVFNTIGYRLLNWPDTMEDVGLAWDWGEGSAGLGKWTRRLRLRYEKGLRTYTGAYMLGAELIHGQPKYLSTIHSLDAAWEYLCSTRGKHAMSLGTLEDLANGLVQNVVRVKGFIAYEVVTDLSYHILSDAPDKNTWANVGPGAIRGLNRCLSNRVKKRMKQEEALDWMMSFYSALKPKWSAEFGTELTLRDIEHSLCEFDKYERVRLGQGKPRQRYKRQEGGNE